MKLKREKHLRRHKFIRKNKSNLYIFRLRKSKQKLILVNIFCYIILYMTTKEAFSGKLTTKVGNYKCRHYTLLHGWQSFNKVLGLL